MMSKNQFTGIETHPQCNRKFCQFNNDQYCMLVAVFFNLEVSKKIVQALI